ncbi:MAG: PASTA domain-containing protein [Bacteroides sp.]|nr:PASTA domain-containing protein [Bacteroides sp.]
MKKEIHHKNETRHKKEIRHDNGFVRRHPVLVNLCIILAVAFIGICIVYFSIAIFTKHGESDKVPGVENMTYTNAISLLHEHGFQVDIRDSLYKDNVKPGYVIEQFPKAGASVKPGRKIFLYINAVHPKEVVIDDDNHPTENALKSFSRRSGLAKLQELGFKHIQVVNVLGDNECIVKIMANGQTVKKMQKVPVNAKLVVQVADGRLSSLRDSLQTEEMIANSQQYSYEDYQDAYATDGADPATVSSGTPHDQSPASSSSSSSSSSASSSSEEEETIEFF